MAKSKIVKSESKNSAWGIFNALPGPTHNHTDTYSDGSQKKGAGWSKSEARRNARKK